MQTAAVAGESDAAGSKFSGQKSTDTRAGPEHRVDERVLRMLCVRMCSCVADMFLLIYSCRAVS